MRDFLRRVGLPSIIDATPATLRPPVHMTPAARLLLLVGRPLWAWRVELVTVLLAVAVLRWLAGHLGIALAVLLVGALALVLALVPEVRRSVLLLYRRAHVRRQWTLAVRHAGLANFNDRVPRVVGHRLTLAGDDLAVRVPAGKTVTEVEDKAETIAAFLRVREVRVHRRPEDAGLAQVMVVVRDPLGTSERWPWPNLAAERLSLWQPIPVGLDEDGELVTLSLVERNILYGGEPGSGKSVAQSLGTATAALDPDVKLHLFDGKYVELAPWAGCAEHMIGPNQDEAIDVLKELVADMDGRYMQLLANKRRKLGPKTACRCMWSRSTSWPSSVTAPTGPPTRPSPSWPATWSAGVGRLATSSRRPPRSRPATPSRLTCATCSPSAGRSAAQPRMPATPSWARAGPRAAIRPTPSTSPTEASATCCTRVAGRCGCAPSTWPISTCTRWPRRPSCCAPTHTATRR